MRKIVFLLPLFFMACTMYQKVSYSTDDIKADNMQKLIPIKVEIRILVDNRAKLTENKVLFAEPQRTEVNGKTLCINSEQHYKKDSVVSQITRMMTEHFNKVRLFNLTLYNQSEFSQYYLTGTLNSFYGEQLFSTGALVGAQFGLIGALATAGIKTAGKVTIEMADLKLFKKDGTLVKDFGSFYKEYKDDYKADAYCWCMYWNINEKLKDFNAHLAEKIRTDLADVKF